MPGKWWVAMAYLTFVVTLFKCCPGNVITSDEVSNVGGGGGGWLLSEMVAREGAGGLGGSCSGQSPLRGV